MVPTRDQRDSSGVDLFRLVEYRVLEPVHEKRKPGEENRHQDDEDSLHALDYPPPDAAMHTRPAGAGPLRARSGP